MARFTMNFLLVAVIFSGAAVTGNDANAGRSSATVRSTKTALLKRKQMQKSKGVRQTVQVRRLHGTQVSKARRYVIGRKKGEVVLHPTLGLLRVNHQSAATSKKAEVRVVESTQGVDRKRKGIVIISDTFDYANEATIEAAHLQAAVQFFESPTNRKELTPDNVFAVSKIFAEKHGLQTARLGNHEVFFSDATTIEPSEYAEGILPFLSLSLAPDRPIKLTTHENVGRFGTTHSAPTKLVNELRAILRRTFRVKVEKSETLVFPTL